MEEECGLQFADWDAVKLWLARQVVSRIGDHRKYAAGCLNFSDLLTDFSCRREVERELYKVRVFPGVVLKVASESEYADSARGKTAAYSLTETCVGADNEGVVHRFFKSGVLCDGKARYGSSRYKPHRRNRRFQLAASEVGQAK